MRDSTIRKLFHSMASARGRRILHAFQEWHLQRQISHAAENSPFYREKFRQHRVNPGDIRKIADLPKLGFFTFPADLQTDPYCFLAVPRQEILYAMSSTGTTGDPKIVFLTRKDWETAVRTVSNGFAMMGVTPADVAQILFCSGNPAWMTGDLVQSGLERLGAFVLPTGNSISTARQIEAMQRFGTTMLLGTPSYLHRLTEEGSQICDLRSLGVRMIRLGAEPWSEALRTLLKEAWGAEVYDSYGMMELSAVGGSECKAFSGLHLTPYLAVEVVDPQTGEPLPPGDLGELVFTTLNRQGSPLLRYRSGDLGRLIPNELCPCGELPTDRISRIMGRSDDMLIIGSGENVFPEQFETAFTRIPGLAGFQVIVSKSGFRDMLLVRVEQLDGSGDVTELIEHQLYENIPVLHNEIFHSRTIAPLQIEYLKPGTLLSESPVKIRHVVDRRNTGG